MLKKGPLGICRIQGMGKSRFEDDGREVDKGRHFGWASGLLVAVDKGGDWAGVLGKDGKGAGERPDGRGFGSFVPCKRRKTIISPPPPPRICLCCDGKVVGS